MKEENMPDLIGSVVDIFEEYLEEKGIEIPNTDRDDAIKDALKDIDCSSLQEAVEKGFGESEADVLSDIGLAHIYGEDYDEIGGEIESAVPHIKDNADIAELTSDTYNAFLRLVDKATPAVTISDEDEKLLKNKVTNMLISWDLIPEV